MTGLNTLDSEHFTVSLVKISDDLIDKVAERTGLTKEDIQKYLNSDQQNRDILQGFAFYGIYPTNKVF
jgi:hypothetical protein